MGVTLERIRSVAAPAIYPRHLLEGCESGLVLFAAGFHGAQDAIWFLEAELTTTCVDRDNVKIEEMRAAYPDTWEFRVADAFDFADLAEDTSRVWDVVSIDCPTNLFGRCEDLLPLWCSLARKAVVLGSGASGPLGVTLPLGWKWTTTVWRSWFKGGAYWLVFEPC